MPEWLKELIIAIGGGATATISILLIVKSLLSKIIDKTIETSFEKSTIKFTNKLERSTRAYEMLLNKEFEFYGKIDPYMATLVPLVQDLEFWLQKHEEEKTDNTKANYKECLLKYLEAIPNLKNDSILYQPYIPVEVFNSVTSLIAHMQDNMKMLGNYGEIIFEKKEGYLDFDKMKVFVEGELKLIALIETLIKARLIELTES